MDKKQKQLTQSCWDFFGRLILFGVAIGIIIKITNGAAVYFGVQTEDVTMMQIIESVVGLFLSAGLLLLIFFIVMTWREKWTRGRNN